MTTVGPRDAVIVATARSPIGRANKGSLVQMRPDDLEAFAAQVLPSARTLGIDIDLLNVNGGAIAVGHPFQMTGARITTTLINSLQFDDKQCVGGQGMAMVLERLA